MENRRNSPSGGFSLLNFYAQAVLALWCNSCRIVILTLTSGRRLKNAVRILEVHET